MRTKFYVEDVLFNSARRFGSATGYYPALLVLASGDETPLLFTPGEITVASERAIKNPEDIATAFVNSEGSEMWNLLRFALVVAVSIGVGMLIMAYTS